MKQIPLVFVNEHFVIVDKPAGALSVPARIKDNRIVVSQVLRETMPGLILPVHRLDAEVSGLLLFARQEASHRAANTWFEQRLVSKTYQAFTDINSKVDQGFRIVWKHKMQRGKKRTFIAEHGKIAVTNAYLLSRHEQECDEWELQPVTGRSHQLRVHLAIFGSPIVGDVLYGSQSKCIVPGIALRSIRLNFASCASAVDFGLPPQIDVQPFAKNNVM